MLLKVFCLVLVVSSVFSDANKKPNIIVIVADDLGYNDIGFHGSDEIPTPNIDALAYNGVILNRHYTQALCTPSRSAFLTGKYPIHLGMQHILILEPEPWGLPLNETLLPEYLKRHGYKTHAVGKWHLGFYKKEYTPMYRGFDTHYGYWQGFQDYYEHTAHSTFTSECGYDMRRNMSVDWDARGKYSTTVFTEEAIKVIKGHNTEEPMFMYMAHLAPHTGNRDNPLQAPDEEIAKFAYIKDPERRVYAAMVSLLDKSVGEVVAALRDKHMLENSIILFMSDNGAQSLGLHANHGSNYPLRGMKTSHWEGGQRGVAAIWSPLIKKPQRVSEELMHISDWLPTFFSAIGLNKSELPQIDGIDMWKSISEGEQSLRTELLYNFDDGAAPWNYAGYRQGDWKYMYGSTSNGLLDLWYGSSGKDPLYHYDENLVLRSHVATSLAGINTFRQINEKYIKKLPENDTNFSINILDPAMIRKLRNAAQVKCKQPDPDKIPEEQRCDPLKSPCLFNIRDDPCETVNMISKRPDVAFRLEQELNRIKKTALPIRNKPRDLNADPDRWGGVWVPWQDMDEVVKQKVPLAIGLVSTVVSLCLAFTIVVVVLVTITVKRKIRSRKNKASDEDRNNEDAYTSDNPKTRFFEDRELQIRHSMKDDARTME